MRTSMLNSGPAKQAVMAMELPPRERAALACRQTANQHEAKREWQLSQGGEEVPAAAQGTTHANKDVGITTIAAY